MASFNVAFSWMMDNEDAARKYATVPDTGGMAISGINSAAYPSDFARINAMPQSLRGPAVADFYQQNFWNQWYAQIESDDVAKRVFDAAVNMGPGTACKLIQEAAGAVPDGAWGPNTVAAINRCDADTLVTAFKQDRLNHYTAIVSTNPSDAKYLGTEEQPGPWWIRSMK
ncbi:MAG TPA: glycosyl hydrolase 108 family protein [Terracidiphilus sp.]|nr:glycosyl hydrolase 108 family protein [Terracidiphilus sp.]